MAKVICKLPNASASINGVEFTPHPDNAKWMVSADLSDEQAAEFASINGYELVGAKPAGKGAKTDGGKGAAGGTGTGAGTGTGTGTGEGPGDGAGAGGEPKQ